MIFCKINDDLDLLFDPEISSQRKIYAPQAPPRFASRGLLIAPRSARLTTNSGIYRKDGALSSTALREQARPYLTPGGDRNQRLGKIVQDLLEVASIPFILGERLKDLGPSLVKLLSGNPAPYESDPRQQRRESLIADWVDRYINELTLENVAGQIKMPGQAVDLLCALGLPEVNSIRADYAFRPTGKSGLKPVNGDTVVVWECNDTFCLNDRDKRQFKDLSDRASFLELSSISPQSLEEVLQWGGADICGSFPCIELISAVFQTRRDRSFDVGTSRSLYSLCDVLGIVVRGNVIECLLSKQSGAMILEFFRTLGRCTWVDPYHARFANLMRGQSNPQFVGSWVALGQCAFLRPAQMFWALNSRPSEDVASVFSALGNCVALDLNATSLDAVLHSHEDDVLVGVLKDLGRVKHLTLNLQELCNLLMFLPPNRRIEGASALLQCTKVTFGLPAFDVFIATEGMTSRQQGEFLQVMKELRGKA